MRVAVWMAIVGAVCDTLPRYLPYDSLYFTGQAVGYLLLLFAVRLLCVSRGSRIALNALCGLALNNLLDELFFDPIHLGANEIVFFILILLYSLYQYIKPTITK